MTVRNIVKLTFYFALQLQVADKLSRSAVLPPRPRPRRPSGCPVREDAQKLSPTSTGDLGHSMEHGMAVYDGPGEMRRMLKGLGEAKDVKEMQSLKSI